VIHTIKAFSVVNEAEAEAKRLISLIYLPHYFVQKENSHPQLLLQRGGEGGIKDCNYTAW